MELIRALILYRPRHFINHYLLTCRKPDLLLFLTFFVHQWKKIWNKLLKKTNAIQSHRVILLTRFCRLLNTVAILTGGTRASMASMARRLWKGKGNEGRKGKGGREGAGWGEGRVVPPTWLVCTTPLVMGQESNMANWVPVITRRQWIGGWSQVSVIFSRGNSLDSLSTLHIWHLILRVKLVSLSSTTTNVLYPRIHMFHFRFPVGAYIPQFS